MTSVDRIVNLLRLAKLIPLLGAFCCVLSSCAPIPHYEYRAPQISGTIFKNGSPLRRTKIYLSRDALKECGKPHLVGETGEKSDFEIDPIRDFKFFVIFYGDPTVWWDLCVKSPAGIMPILSQGGIGMSPEALRVTCDLSRKKDIYIPAFGEIRGKCESRAQ